MNNVLNPPSGKDQSSYTLFKFNTKTGRQSIEGQITVVGLERAEERLADLLEQLSPREKEQGWTWRIKPNSATARDRQAGIYKREGK